MSDNGKSVKILEGKESGMLFEDNWYKTYKNKSLLLKELFTYSIFQSAKQEKKQSICYNFQDGKYLTVEGYVNSLNQKIFLILMNSARENLHTVQIGNNIYDKCILLERKKLFSILHYPLNRGSYLETVRASQKRLKALNITHNFWEKVDETIGFFSNVGYIRSNKSFYFVISEEYKNLNDRLFLKAFDLNEYLQLKNNLSCFLWLSLRFLFDHKNCPKVRHLKLHTLLKRCGKIDWIKNAHKKDYFRSKIFHYLFPALAELRKKNCFAFKAPARGKYDLDANYSIERLYPLKRDDLKLVSPSAGELGDLVM
jgi:hypothetical protein